MAADHCTVLHDPTDVALPPGELGVSRSFADRMARNTQLLLLEESHLGHVQDPGAEAYHTSPPRPPAPPPAWGVGAPPAPWVTVIGVLMSNRVNGASRNAS
ncbi:methylmalonyl-CoA mutase family protein [Nocardia cyriacigeorgica]|uniref:methylmalonyl-CoA mutase family protein n=1 Tax=Nocardia cyriacigeorgica TaxID=135487 RepID=UPI003CC7DA14